MLLAGCTYPTAGSYGVDFDGVPERTVEGFRMQGQVAVDPTTAPTRNFTDVTIVLYDQNWSVIERVPLGPMSTDSEYYPERRSVNITTAQQPAYVRIESPEFEEGDVAVEGYRWTGSYYKSVYITITRFLPESVRYLW
jgi:hypothetical protein